MADLDAIQKRMDSASVSYATLVQRDMPVLIVEIKRLEAQRDAVLALHPRRDEPRHGCCAPPRLCQGHGPECAGAEHGLLKPSWPCPTVRALGVES